MEPDFLRISFFFKNTFTTAKSLHTAYVVPKKKVGSVSKAATVSAAAYCCSSRVFGAAGELVSLNPPTSCSSMYEYNSMLLRALYYAYSGSNVTAMNIQMS